MFEKTVAFNRNNHWKSTDPRRMYGHNAEFLIVLKQVIQ
jgi:hypothetical protein